MSKNYHECIIPAMDILIGDPDILSPEKTTKKKADHLYIPLEYVDRIDDFYHEQTTRGDSARQLTITFGNMLEHIHQTGQNYVTMKNGMVVHFESVNLDSDSSKQHAIQLAKELQKRGERVAIMTGSPRMVMKAAAAKVDLAHASPEVYTGHRTVIAGSEFLSRWNHNGKITESEWRDYFPKEDPLRPNEFVIFNFKEQLGTPYYHQTGNPYFHIGRFDPYDKNGRLVHLKHAKFSSAAYRRIAPITPIQAMYLEALLAPAEEIPVVVFSGVYGVGKTFLPIAVGLEGCGYHSPSHIYERVFVVPRDGALGRDVGFLPGDLTAKTMPKAKPILDNLKEVVKLLDIRPQDLVEPELETRRKKAKKIEEPTPEPLRLSVEKLLKAYFEFEPLINMGGRSISDSLIIYDEFQDMERFQARELVSRIGNNSKMVIMGDPSQTSNIHLSKTSNGLNYIASKLAAEPFAAVISTFNEDDIVRSWAAQQVAKALKS